MEDAATKAERASMTGSRYSIALAASLMLAAGSAWAETPVQRGEVIARGLCSPCHAIGTTGESRHPAAPRFRVLDNQTDLSKLSRRIREGILTGHEDMPLFRFNGGDADAVVAYIRSIQGP
jgi:mono/diheme cytochrome c family protein